MPATDLSLGGAERGHPFFGHRILAKKGCFRKLMINRKKKLLDLSPYQKVLREIEEMADIFFLNSANFAPHAFDFSAT